MLIFPLLRLFGCGLDSSFLLYIYAGRMDVVQRVYAIHLYQQLDKSTPLKFYRTLV